MVLLSLEADYIPDSLTVSEGESLPSLVLHHKERPDVQIGVKDEGDSRSEALQLYPEDLPVT